ncbi:hypothetical protein CYMTET_5009, partial [Cymbomonas tetramitiformis]
DAGVDLSRPEVDTEGRTALTVALAFGQEAAARALLEAGAGVNAGTGWRPLHAAAEKGMVVMVRELVGKGAEVDAEDVVNKKLALSERGKLKAGDVLHFVLRGAVLEVALNDSPFEEAFTELPGGVVPFVQFGFPGNVVELVGSARAMTLQEIEVLALIEMGADVNAGSGQRALHLAAKNGLHEAWAEARGLCFSAEILQLVQE